MRSIGHLSALYSFWFGDEDAFRSRLPDLFFIGFQERLDDDFELLKQKLGLPPDAELPRGEAAHQAPAGYDVHLGDVARANLERWYADDLAFVQLCRELAPRVNARHGLTAMRARVVDPVQQERVGRAPAMYSSTALRAPCQ